LTYFWLHFLGSNTTRLDCEPVAGAKMGFHVWLVIGAGGVSFRFMVQSALD